MGFRISGFRVQDLGFRIKDLGCLGFGGVLGCLGVWGPGFGVFGV